MSGQLSRNTVLAVVQAIFVTASIFLAYRLVIGQVGLERLGIWSLLLSGSAVARIGDISGAGVLSRFVAMGAHRHHKMWARDTVHTVLLTSVALNTVLSLALWLAAPIALRRFVAPQHLADAISLVPFAIASFFLGALASAVSSGIDGAQRADRRALVVMAAALVLVATSYLLVPKLDILGFAISQLVYQGFILVVGWLVLRRHVSGLGWFPLHWNREIFFETTGYALKANGIGVMILLFEPLAKFSINSIGGPASVALYELASRLVVRVRDLSTAAAAPLIPVFAAHASTRSREFRHTLLAVTRLVAIAAIVNVAIVLTAAPLISLIVLQRIDPTLLIFVAVLAAAWNLQLPALGFYVAAQAQGKLWWNFVSHALIAGFVVGGSRLLMPSLGSYGVLAAIAGGFVSSLVPVFLGNARSLQASEVLRHALGRIGVSAASILIIVVSYLTWVGAWMF